MFDFLKSDLELIRGEAVHFLTKNLGLSKPTAKQVASSIDNHAAEYLLSITPDAGIVQKSIRRIIAAKLAYLMAPEQEHQLIKAIAVDVEYVLGTQIPMAAVRGELLTDSLSNSAVWSGLIESYITERFH